MAGDASHGGMNPLPFALGGAPSPWSDLQFFGIHAEAHMIELTLNLGADVEEVTTIAMPITASDWSLLVVIPDMLEPQILAGPGTAADEVAPWLGPHMIQSFLLLDVSTQLRVQPVVSLCLVEIPFARVADYHVLPDLLQQSLDAATFGTGLTHIPEPSEMLAWALEWQSKHRGMTEAVALEATMHTAASGNEEEAPGPMLSSRKVPKSGPKAGAAADGSSGPRP